MFLRRFHKSAGFNLLEVAIAGFIFAAVSIAFLGVWGLQVRSLEKSRHNLVANMLAEELIEEAMDQGFERVQEIDEDAEPIILELEQQTPQGEWTSIEVRYQPRRIVTVIGDEDDKLKRVEVTVTWEDSTRTGEITLITYLAGVY